MQRTIIILLVIFGGCDTMDGNKSWTVHYVEMYKSNPWIGLTVNNGKMPTVRFDYSNGETIDIPAERGFKMYWGIYKVKPGQSVTVHLIKKRTLFSTTVYQPPTDKAKADEPN